VVSLDGARPETHDAIRGMKGCFEKAVNAIKIAKEHCQVKQVNFVLQKDNYLELPDFLKLAKQLEVQVSLIPVSQKLAAQNPLSQNLIEFDLPRLKQILDEAFAFGNILNNRAFIDLFLTKLEKGAVRHPCMAPYNCILIYSNGDIYPCGNLDVTAGNLDLNSRLGDLYAGYEAIRKEIWSGQHPFCNKCIYPDITNRHTLLSGTSQFIQKRLSGNTS
jgi:MoaA/NifB/PqqE/SkfB family radical SAM enzyme